MSTGQRNPPVDLSRLTRTMGDLQAALGLLGLYVEQTEGQLRSLEAALAAADFKQVRNLAHAIKGSSANSRIDRMEELAGSLEARMVNEEHAQNEALVTELVEEFARVRTYIENYRRTAE